MLQRYICRRAMVGWAVGLPMMFALPSCGSANSEMYPHAVGSDADPLTKEAYSVVDELLRGETIPCGKDAFYFKVDMTPPANVRYYRNFSYSVTGEPAKGADKANGLEWVGAYSLHADMFNDYVPESPYTGAAHWTKWTDQPELPGDGLYLEKYRGKWYLSDEHRTTPEEAIQSLHSSLTEQTARNEKGHFNINLDCNSFKQNYGFSDSGATVGRSQNDLDQERLRALSQEKLQQLRSRDSSATVASTTTLSLGDFSNGRMKLSFHNGMVLVNANGTSIDPRPYTLTGNIVEFDVGSAPVTLTLSSDHQTLTPQNGIRGEPLRQVK